MITPTTKLTAIFGNPVTHSLSPFLHNAVYEREGIDARMLAFGNADVKPLVEAMRALPIYLAAVTMPHKQTIIAHLDEIDTEARAIGAVNTVVNRQGKLFGYNTDIAGIAKALDAIMLRGSSVLLIGAGGAARTVAYLLKREGASIFCMNREHSQAQDLVEAFGGTIIGAEALSKKTFEVVINATPVGMRPNVSETPFPEELIRADMAIFDLVYSPLGTKLLKSARAQGARAISGLTMFLEQGLEQERIWLNRQIDGSKYQKMLEEYVKNRE